MLLGFKVGFRGGQGKVLTGIKDKEKKGKEKGHLGGNPSVRPSVHADRSCCFQRGFGWSSKVPCKRLLSGCLRETQGLIQILERDTAIGRARGTSVLAPLGSGDQSMIRWVAGSTLVVVQESCGQMAVANCQGKWRNVFVSLLTSPLLNDVMQSSHRFPNQGLEKK